MDFRNKLVFDLGKPFQPSLVFMGKAKSLPLSGEQYFIRLEKPARNKHVIYDHKNFNNWPQIVVLVTPMLA